MKVAHLVTVDHLMFNSILLENGKLDIVILTHFFRQLGLKDWACIQIGTPGMYSGIPRVIMKSLSIASEVRKSMTFSAACKRLKETLGDLCQHFSCQVCP